MFVEKKDLFNSIYKPDLRSDPVASPPAGIGVPVPVHLGHEVLKPWPKLARWKQQNKKVFHRRTSAETNSAVDLGHNEEKHKHARTHAQAHARSLAWILHSSRRARLTIVRCFCFCHYCPFSTGIHQ